MYTKIQPQSLKNAEWPAINAEKIILSHRLCILDNGNKVISKNSLNDYINYGQLCRAMSSLIYLPVLDFDLDSGLLKIDWIVKPASCEFESNKHDFLTVVTKISDSNTVIPIVKKVSDDCNVWYLMLKGGKND